MNQKINHQTERDVYTTAELALAAGLVTLGYEFLQLEGDNPNRLFFVFGDDDELPGLETAFYAGKMLVDAQAFGIALRRLKDVLYEEKRRQLRR